MNIYDELNDNALIMFDSFLEDNVEVIILDLFHPSPDNHGGEYLRYKGYILKSEKITIASNQICDIQFSKGLFINQTKKFQNAYRQFDTNSKIDVKIKFSRPGKKKLEMSFFEVIKK